MARHGPQLRVVDGCGAGVPFQRAFAPADSRAPTPSPGLYITHPPRVETWRSTLSCCFVPLYCFDACFVMDENNNPSRVPPPPGPRHPGSYMCSICTIVLKGETSWKQHVRGTPHKKRAQRAASIDVANNPNGPSLRWTCPTCLVCNDLAAGLFATSGARSTAGPSRC